MAEQVATSTGADKEAPDVTGKAGEAPDTTADVEPKRVIAAEEKAATACSEEAAEGAVASTSATAGVATAAAATETKAAATAEAEAGAWSGGCSLEDAVSFAIENGVSKDAAVRVTAELQACAAEAAADGEDDEAFECIVMKRGNYWPYFWSQRLLVVERRSLLYFATPLPTAGEAPRGFFPLQPNTRLLFSVDRVSLYGRTEGLLLGIFNVPLSAAASAEPSSPAASASPAAATTLLLSPASWTGNQCAHVSHRPLYLPQLQHHQQRQGVAATEERRNGDERSLAPPHRVSAQAAASLPRVSGHPVAVSGPTLPVSFLVASIRSVVRWFSSSTDDSSQLTVREASANAHTAAEISEATAASSGSLPTFTGPLRASAAYSSSTFASSSSYTPAYSLSSLFSSSAFSSSTPILFPVVSLCSASPSLATVPASPGVSSSANGVPVSPLFSSARESLESGSAPLLPSAYDVLENGTRKRNSHQSSAMDNDFCDAEEDRISAVTLKSAEASSVAAPSPSASRSSSAPSCKGRTLSSGSFFSLPSTPSFPLLSCASSPSHASPPPASSGSSEFCPPISEYRGSLSDSPPFDRFSSTSASSSSSLSASHSHSSSSSSSSFSSSAPGVTPPDPTSAGAVSSPLSTVASTAVSSSSGPVAPAPVSSRAHVTPVLEDVSSMVATPSSSVSLLSGAVQSCNSLASPAVDVCGTTGSEKSDAVRRGMGATYEQTEHPPLKVRPKLQQKELQLQQGHDQLQHPVQQRLRRPDQWQHQVKNFRENSGLPSDAQKPLECCSTVAAPVAVQPKGFLRSAQTVNPSKDAAFAGSTSCVNSDNNRRSQGSSTEACGHVAAEPPVLLACSQETFATEFNRASKPKFLFEFADPAQQRRIACAITRAILRIRRQARRKHEQEKQRLQERLDQGLLTRQQEPSAAQQYRLPPAEGRQHLPRGLDEELRQQKSLSCLQQQCFQRPLARQHLQTEELTARPVSWCQTSSFQRESSVRKLSPPNAEASPPAFGRTDLSSASPEAGLRGGAATVLWRNPGVEEGLGLPRLLNESAEANVLVGMPSVIRGFATSSTAYIAAATAVGRSVGAKVNQVVLSRPRRSSVGNGRPEPCLRRNTHHLAEMHWNIRASESYVRECIRRSSFSHDSTTNVAATNRSRSDESVSVRAQRRRTADDKGSGEALSAKAASAAAVKEVGEAGGQEPLPVARNGGTRNAWKRFPRRATAPTPSHHRSVEHDWESWLGAGTKGSSHTELHPRGELTEIVGELLEMLSSPEGIRCVECISARDQSVLDRGFQAHKREDRATKQRCWRTVGLSQPEERGPTEQLLEEGRETQLPEARTEQQQFREASEPRQRQVADISQHESEGKLSRRAPQAFQPHLFEGHHQRGETSVRDEERYVRLVRALTRLRDLVSRDPVNQFHRCRKQRSLQTDSFGCCKNDVKLGVLPTGITDSPRRQRSASTTILQEASDALFEASQSSVPEKIEATNDRRIRCGAVTSSPRRVVAQGTATARSDAHSKLSVTSPSPPGSLCCGDEKAEVTGSGGSLSSQTLTGAFASSKKHQTEQAAPVEQTQHGIPAHLSAQLLEQFQGATSRAEQQRGGSSSSPEHQRIRAASLLLLEQREQLERLKSVVDFLMRERELQFRFGYQVNEAELQQQWEEEQRRFEAERQQPPLAAAHLLQGELKAYEESEEQHLIVDDGQKEVAPRRDVQPWEFSDGRKARVGAPHFRGLGKGEVFPKGQRQVAPCARESRTQHERSKQPLVAGRSSPVRATAFERGDGLSTREKAPQHEAPGGTDADDVLTAEPGMFGGGVFKSSDVASNRFVEKNSPAKKGDTNSTASLRFEDREARDIESDTQDHEKQRSKHPDTPVEPPIICRISTPPSSSRESDAGETIPEQIMSRERNTSRLRHQSSY